MLATDVAHSIGNTCEPFKMYLTNGGETFFDIPLNDFHTFRRIYCESLAPTPSLTTLFATIWSQVVKINDKDEYIIKPFGIVAQPELYRHSP